MEEKSVFAVSEILTVVFVLLCSATVAQRGVKAPAKLTVSFISIGAGTDYKAENRVLDFVSDFQQRHHTDTLYKVVRWGKEGETDYNFDLRRLSAKQRNELKQGLAKLLEGNTLVTISDKPKH